MIVVRLAAILAVALAAPPAAEIDDILGTLDAAAELLLVELPVESSGITCLFGVPTEGQRARAGNVARRMYELTGAVELAADRVIRAVADERGPDAAAARQRLGEARRARLPFLRGVAAFLEAEFNVDDPAARRALNVLAADLLEGTVPLLEGRRAAMAALYGGLARLRCGDDAAAQRLLERVLETPGAAPGDVLAARLGLAAVAAATGGPQAGLDELDRIRGDVPGLFAALLVADERFRLLSATAGGGAAGRAAPYAAYLELLDGDLGPTDRVREVVRARLAAVLDEQAPVDRLPPIARIAAAERAAREPGTRAEAAAALAAMIDGDLGAADRADALLVLGRALVHDDPRGSAERFAQLAREHPDSAHARRAIELAATIAAELYRSAPADPRNRLLLRETLHTLLAGYPDMPDVDRWRYWAGCLALDDGRDEDALAAFAAVGPGARHADARFRMLQAMRDAGRWVELLASIGDVEDDLAAALHDAEPDHGEELERMARTLPALRAEALLAAGEADAALEALEGAPKSVDVIAARIRVLQALGRLDEASRAADELIQLGGAAAGPALGRLLESTPPGADPAASLPVAEALRPWLDAHGGPAAHARLALRAADAFRKGGRCAGAMALYDALGAAQGDAIEVLLGRAECLYALGEDADAMALFARLATSLGPEDGTYWQAHMRMLQILDRTGRNTESIEPHIQRLRRTDPSLGGEPYLSEFERLLLKR